MRCRHFGECGGCQCQDVAYDEQLARKGAALSELFQPFWSDPIPVTPSPEIWHYRNKVDFAFGLKRYPEPPPKDFVRETVLGFKRRGRWYWPLDMDECLIGPEGMDGLLGAVRSWARDAGLRAFDSRRKEGLLRILLVRAAKRTGQRMVVLTTADAPFDPSGFVDAVRRMYPADSVYHGVFHGLADVAAADELQLLDGQPTIEERLEIPTDEGTRALRFRWSPFSFFQTNTLAAERLYAAIRAWVKAIAPETLYDLYGGAGGIAFTCADLVDRVISVENVVSATEDGEHNARTNGIANVTFITQNVERFLGELRITQGFPPNSAVIVDPPRSGLHPKALRRLAQLRPRALLYVSCKPQALARELPALLEAYRLDNLQAVDMFPHTDHVEVLASLTRA